MSRYPWSILGIDPTSDQVLIRKAYALRLKVTRPDEDPKCFQALVEARDRALNEAKRSPAQSGNHDRAESRREPERDKSADKIIEQADVSQRSVVVVTQEPGPDHARSQQAGSVIIEDVAANDDTLVDEDGDELNVFDVALANIGRKHPWETLEFQWSAVFDAVEEMPLALSELYFRIALQRLAHNLTYHKSADGAYKAILIEFEKRFSVLRNDRILFDHLAQEEAEHFIELLEKVVGRPEPKSTEFPRRYPDLDLRYVEAAFGANASITDTYKSAVTESGIPIDISFLPLLAPIVFCLARRMYAYVFIYFSIFALSVPAQITGMKFFIFGLDVTAQIVGMQSGNHFLGLAGIFMIVIKILFSFGLFFYGSHLRLKRLNALVLSLRKKNCGEDEIIARVKKWARPNWIAIAGIAPMMFLFGFSWLLL